jgi:transposase
MRMKADRLPPGRYCRFLIGYFEGLDAERAIAWRAADSFALREFLGLVFPEAPPDHSTISRTRRLFAPSMHRPRVPSFITWWDRTITNRFGTYLATSRD